ncbi:MAG: hypothetical protein AAB425_14920, partial [Bdellovibrionota bacterium]
MKKINNKLSLVLAVTGLTFGGLTTVGCGNGTSASSGTETTDDTSDTEAAAEAVQSAGAAAEGSASVASLRIQSGYASLRVLEWLEPSAYAASTSICDKVIEVACTDNVKSATFLECKMHDLELAPVWNGGMTLTFDSAATCEAVDVENKSAPSSGSMIRSFASGTILTYTNRRGKSVVEALDSSENLEAWDGTLVAGGGIQVTFEAGNTSQI